MENQTLGQTIKHEKVREIIVEYGLDSEGNEDWCCEYCHSSAVGFEEDTNKETKLKCFLNELKEKALKEGYKEENIKVIEKPLTEEKINEFIKCQKERDNYYIPLLEKQVNGLRTKLAEEFKKLSDLKRRDYEKWKNELMKKL